MPSSLVTTADRGAARPLVLNRPEKRNAFNAELVLAVGGALREAADDRDVHCVVVRGEGPMFSSGMDIGALNDVAAGAERSEEHTSELQSRQYLVCRLLLEKKKK